MKQYIISISIILALSGCLIFTIQKCSSYKDDYSRQKNNVTALTSPVIRDTLPGGITVVKVPVIDENVRELRKQQIIGTQLIRDLNLKIKDLKAYETVKTETGDTIPVLFRDSVFNYKDSWTDIHINLRNNLLSYKTFDSTTAIVAAEYKHHFLFWRWGIKGYKLHLVNYNPHSTITCAKYVNISK